MPSRRRRHSRFSRFEWGCITIFALLALDNLLDPLAPLVPYAVTTLNFLFRHATYLSFAAYAAIRH